MGHFALQPINYGFETLHNLPKMRGGNHQTVSIERTAYEGSHCAIIGNGNTITGHHNKIFGNDNTFDGCHNRVSGVRNRGKGHHNTLFGGDSNSCDGSFNKARPQQLEIPSPASSSDEDDGKYSAGTVIVSSGGGVSGNVFVNGKHYKVNGAGSLDIVGGVVFVGGKRIKSLEEEAEPRYVEVPTEHEQRAQDTEVPEDAADDALTCVVCLLRAPVCAAVPCMHRRFCCACARSLAQDGTKQRGTVACPVCKAQVEAFRVVY